jgi:hypothetical protein
MDAWFIFNSVVKESMEMLYQYDSDYLFDSTKFNNAFSFNTTPYEEGIRKTVESMK